MQHSPRDRRGPIKSQHNVASVLCIQSHIMFTNLWGVFDGCRAHLNIRQIIQISEPRDSLGDGREKSTNHRHPQAADQRDHR